MSEQGHIEEKRFAPAAEVLLDTDFGRVYVSGEAAGAVITAVLAFQNWQVQAVSPPELEGQIERYSAYNIAIGE